MGVYFAELQASVMNACRVQGIRSRVQDLRFRIQGLGLRVARVSIAVLFLGWLKGS